MAKCKVSGLDDLIADLGSMVDDLDATMKDALNSASGTLVSNTKSKIRAAANRGYSTGTLAGSVSATKAAKNKYGYFVAVRPTGQDSKGVRNGEKWGYLEHGVAGAQDAHPFIDDAVAASEDACTATIEEIFESHIPKELL